MQKKTLRFSMKFKTSTRQRSRFRKAVKIMEHEKTRREFFETEIRNMASQIASILDNGYSVEIAKSRSGLKLFAVKRRYEIVKKQNFGHRPEGASNE